MTPLCFDSLKKSLATSLQQIINHKDLGLEHLYQELNKAPNFKMGHYAFPCFPLAKILRKGPPQIAKDLVSKLPNESEVYSKVEAQGPYVNFFLKPEAMAIHVLEKVLSGEMFTSSLVEHAEKTMIEYSQPNTHKEMHVGHMRNLCLGNSLIHLQRYAGIDTLAVTYPGDMGTHVAKCLWYLKNHTTEQAPEKRKGAWLGKIYTQAEKKLQKEIGTTQEQPNRQKLTEILKGLESGTGEYFDLWQKTRSWSIDLMKDVYSWANVDFDRWFFESEFDSSSVQLMKNYYKAGKLQFSEGAIGMDLTEDKLGFCLLLKTDGTGLYATKDIELAKIKFQDFKIEKNIYIVDSRQAYHFKQVFKVLEKLGFEHASQCFHLGYEFVELPEGAMSSRAGNIIPLQSLIDEMEAKIKEDYLNKYKDEWSEKEIKQTATCIARGAIEFGMLRIDPQKKIVFNMVEWLKLDGESGPYLQYVCARIQSLLKRGEKENFKSSSLISFNSSLLSHDCEQELLFEISRFNEICLLSVKQYKPSHLCSYLYDLGKLFNQFYVACPIFKLDKTKQDQKELMSARLSLVNGVLLTLKKGLELLGIQTPERM